MQISPVARRVTGVVAWLIAFHVLLAYGLPEGMFIVLVLSLAALYWRTGVLAAVTVTLSLLLVTFVYWAALEVTGFEDRIYFRPDEKYMRFDYANNHRVYQPNVRVEAQMPHGDLRSMTTADIAEPRRIVFQTDRDGFRNEHDYHGQPWVLIGDSFIAGTGNSQEDILVSQLLRDHGVDTYSLAYPGNLAVYLTYLRGFQKRYGNQARVLLFLFEGNDFDEIRARPESAVARYGRRYYGMFSEFNTYRVTRSLINRFTRGRRIHAGSDLQIHELAQRPMAFLKRYEDVTRRTAALQPEGFAETLAAFKPALARVYFVPTKFRVYHPLLEPGTTLPNAQWEYLNRLCVQLDLRCTNLTAPLARESAELLKKGELTFWRDDTHWNRHGIAVAARTVAADLGARRLNPTRRD